ncbi:DarT ssDNA thymidine ADP-ribosyltransferase family protein [Chryseobacterium sp. SIMBA_038]|uniref:DarT ssDNA thymidine ADP-ribosyltransferase family protein n=2 Tax=Pseudomonadati TaxID=3379134 RepID=UPI00397CB717
MSLRTVIHNTFEGNTDYEKPHQVVNQARSLKYLSSDLYSGTTRFIYELIQNADDSSIDGNKVSLMIKMFGDTLVVAHTGKQFDERDVRGITGIDDGTKKNALDKTGFKGIGFKSVFGQSEYVTVYSDGEYFRFDANYIHNWNEKWGESQQSWEVQTGQSFEMPWQIIPIYTEVSEVDTTINEFLSAGDWTVATIIKLKNITEIKKGIAQLASNANMYLFLKNIAALSFQSDATTSIEIIDKEEGNTVIKVNGEEKANWLKHTITLPVPEITKRKLAEDRDVPEKLKATSVVDITFAAKIVLDKIQKLDALERLLYAYLPTEEKNYDIPVLVNASFYTVANRESLHQDSPFNEWLFDSIPSELIKWIASMVEEQKYDAYSILPEKLPFPNNLANAYNTSLVKALKEVPFVVNKQNELLKTDETIIDYTNLSNRSFFDPQFIRSEIMGNGIRPTIAATPFVKEIGYKSKLKKAGVIGFTWPHVEFVLKNPAFVAEHTLENNKLLIIHLKEVAENADINELTNEILKSWPFILNHRNELKSPKEVFFPATGETYEEETDLSFINPALQEWLDTLPETKTWLENLGVVEKSDLTFVIKRVIPHISTYITTSNAVKETTRIFNLFDQGKLSPEIFSQLKNLRILTTNNTLTPARNCFLSNKYRPRLSIDGILTEDIYVNSVYVSDETKIREWKAFFLALGVNEGIDTVKYVERTAVGTLERQNIEKAFINRREHTYNWLQNDYHTEEIKNLISLNLLEHTINNGNFATIFWNDVLNNISPSVISTSAIGYSGKRYKPSWIDGKDIENYLKWYVKNMPSIPVKTGECLSSDYVILNNPDNVKLCGTYLPVFNGPELNADWREFFNFKQHLDLDDYLLLLKNISQDPSVGNKASINIIYKYLLDKCLSWGTEIREKVHAWALEVELLDKDGKYISSTTLKYYKDGDNSIFGDTYKFIYLDADARNHPELITLLEILGIEVLSQDRFGVETSSDIINSDLHERLNEIIPFWAKLMETERQSGYEEMLYDLKYKFDQLEFKEASEIFIVYGVDLRKKVHIHFDRNTLYLTKPWKSPKLMMTLPDKLCEIFKVKNYANELRFLLGSSIAEIKEYFEEENLVLPPVADILQITAVAPETSQEQIEDESTSMEFEHDFNHKPKADYQKQWNDSTLRNAELIEAYSDNPKEFLIKGLEQFNGSAEPMIYHFSHLNNAVSIIREKAIKCRGSAVFLDSAGSGIISQTIDDRKDFARFYFRPKTPTQYYIENLGRGNESLEKIGSDPICPVPVFFVIPLKEALEQDWNVSIGSLASPQTEYGKDIEILKKFDFEGVYQNMPPLSWQRFRIASHQEFLLKDQLDLSDCNFDLVVQNESAKESLLSMLGDLAPRYRSKIKIDESFYNGDNAQIKIDKNSDQIKASITIPHDGTFILQHSSTSEWHSIKSAIKSQFNNNDWITTFGDKNIVFQGYLEHIKYKIFYNYRGRQWLVQTNTEDYNFDLTFSRAALDNWMNSPDVDVDGLFSSLKLQPEFSYWFGRSIGGPDDLNLEQHTREVISNYLCYFSGKQTFFPTEKEYLLCLALHDIGKPVAVEEKNRKLQHKKSLEILDRNKEILPLSERSFEIMKIVIDADPIGKFLNTNEEFFTADACAEINAMGVKLEVPLSEFVQSLFIYYQCDAAGYQSLKKRLFLYGEDELLTLNSDSSLLSFNDEYEQKFKSLVEAIEFFY